MLEAAVTLYGKQQLAVQLGNNAVPGVLQVLRASLVRTTPTCPRTLSHGPSRLGRTLQMTTATWTLLSPTPGLTTGKC